MTSSGENIAVSLFIDKLKCLKKKKEKMRLRILGKHNRFYRHRFKHIGLTFALFWTQRTNSDLHILSNVIIWAICPH